MVDRKMGLQDVDNPAATFGRPGVPPCSSEWPLYVKICLATHTLPERLSKKERFKTSQLNLAKNFRHNSVQHKNSILMQNKCYLIS